jgi:hypothetical protein
MAGVDFPADRIHSTTISGEPKAQVLKQLALQHTDVGAKLFVEDKFGTLNKVSKGRGRTGTSTGTSTSTSTSTSTCQCVPHLPLHMPAASHVIIYLLWLVGTKAGLERAAAAAA